MSIVDSFKKITVGYLKLNRDSIRAISQYDYIVGNHKLLKEQVAIISSRCPACMKGRLRKFTQTIEGHEVNAIGCSHCEFIASTTVPDNRELHDRLDRELEVQRRKLLGARLMPSDPENKLAMLSRARWINRLYWVVSIVALCMSLYGSMNDSPLMFFNGMCCSLIGAVLALRAAHTHYTVKSARVIHFRHWLGNHPIIL